jgi:hypothetical protein
MKQKSIDATLAYFAEVEYRKRHAPKFNSYARDNRKHGGGAKPFRNVPPHLRDIAWEEYHRLYRKAQESGKPITQQKIGSMMANAAYIAMYVRGSRRYRRWCVKWWKRRYMFRQWLTEGLVNQGTKRDPNSPRTFIHLT